MTIQFLNTIFCNSSIKFVKKLVHCIFFFINMGSPCLFHKQLSTIHCYFIYSYRSALIINGIIISQGVENHGKVHFFFELILRPLKQLIIKSYLQLGWLPMCIQNGLIYLACQPLPATLLYKFFKGRLGSIFIHKQCHRLLQLLLKLSCLRIASFALYS